jgi:hypothetical protein
MLVSVESSNPVHNQVLLGVDQLWKNGKREHFPASLLRLRELSFTATEMSKGGLQVDAKRVINLGRDASQPQVLLQSVPSVGADGELVEGVLEVSGRGDRARNELRESGLIE